MFLIKNTLKWSWVFNLTISPVLLHSIAIANIVILFEGHSFVHSIMLLFISIISLPFCSSTKHWKCNKYNTINSIWNILCYLTKIAIVWNWEKWLTYHLLFGLNGMVWYNQSRSSCTLSFSYEWYQPSKKKIPLHLVII